VFQLMAKSSEVISWDNEVIHFLVSLRMCQKIINQSKTT
jgi:hypothetical protein